LTFPFQILYNNVTKIIYRLNEAIGFSVSDLNSAESCSLFYRDKLLLFTEYTGSVFVIKNIYQHLYKKSI